MIDGTRHWAGWVHWLSVSHLTFFAALGAVIAAGRDHRESFQLLRPGYDLAAARAARAAAGQPEQIVLLPNSLYGRPDLRRRDEGDRGGVGLRPYAGPA
ncbi:MAG TPA: hypothetical protein PKD53_19060 [Chloroflexaceae bacterium]|nr:hypothetical protein [Chloroflexaceae bacterium]